MNGSLPKAYKLGVQDFYGRDFLVSPDVLIPRPETEGIIDMVLSLAGVPYLSGVKVSSSVLPKQPKILDVGTGSGCIAITLKKQLPDADITACDVSSKALEIARKNAENLKAEINFVQSDLTKNTGVDFDVIVANLPYVDEKWEWLDKKSLSYEPSLALYTDDDGLALIKRLIEEISSSGAWSFADKYLILEADPCQHERIKKYAQECGFDILRVSGFVILLGRHQELR